MYLCLGPARVLCRFRVSDSGFVANPADVDSATEHCSQGLGCGFRVSPQHSTSLLWYTIMYWE